MHNIVRTASDNVHFRSLILQLDNLLQLVDGKDHTFYAQFNNVETIKNVVLFFENEIPVGCGAFKSIDNQTIEIKRMYVEPTFRKTGIASTILNELEHWAKEENFSIAILETGKKLENAISLYKKVGYLETENYGQYKGVESSVCFKKILK